MAPISGRSLLQQPNCGRITNCQECYNAKNDDSVTVLVCRVCATGYRPTSDGGACECAPGYTKLGGTGACSKCTVGNYCLGGDASATPCGTGLTTLTEAARSVEQCVALPGYGYSKTRTTVDGNITVTVTAGQCELNFYNPGSNTLPCRRCPGGLITTAVGTTNVRSCLAGPGYLFDKLVAKPCPRGTWKSTTSTATACTKCPPGLTTPAVASTSQDQCTQALPGFKVVVSGQSGAACEKNTYNIGYNTVTSCTVCPDSLVTLSTGSKSEGSCLAPPGVGYYPADTPKTRPCDMGFYKAGYNRKACSDCGSGFLTKSTGSDSKQKCYVPYAHGTVKVTDTTTQVIQCSAGLFGYPVDTFGIFSLPCRACQAGMATWDQNSASPGNAPNTTNVTNSVVQNMSPDDCWTMPGYGYDKKAQASKICEPGFYNAGWNKDPCYPCGDGYTTASEGAQAESECVIAPGWFWDTRALKPVPCDKGFWCPGLSLLAEPVQCPNGTTTSQEGSKAKADCDVCSGGYGSWATVATGPTCDLCAADTYGPEGSVAACSNCEDGWVSAPGSDSKGDCYDKWQNLKKDFDFLPIDPAFLSTLLAEQTGNFTNEDACKKACDTAGFNCVFYQYDTNSAKCYIYQAPAKTGNVRLGMKIDEGVYSVYGASSDSTKIGAVAGTFTQSSVNECTRKCDEVERCVALVITKNGADYTCDLRAGALSADLRTKYQVSGSNVGSWVL